MTSQWLWCVRLQSTHICVSGRYNALSFVENSGRVQLWVHSFFFWKNIYFSCQAEYPYFSADFRLNTFLDYKVIQSIVLSYCKITETIDLIRPELYTFLSYCSIVLIEEKWNKYPWYIFTILLNETSCDFIVFYFLSTWKRSLWEYSYKKRVYFATVAWIRYVSYM